MEIYLIRHTTPEVDSGVCYGQTDIEPASSFEAELERVKQLVPQSFDQIFSSPLKRCYHLAKSLSSAHSVRSDNRLKELHFGSWEMKKWDTIPAEELNGWMADFVNVSPPDGENFLDLYNRAGLFFDEILKSEHKTIAVVTHAGVIRAMIARILEMPLSNAFKIPVPYSSVTKIRVDDELCYCSIDYLSKQ
jgi:alpha-ribazole phosphatase